VSIRPGGGSALLEREDSLTSLGQLLADVRTTRQGQLVLLAGEAGVGKTALLRGFTAAQGERTRVLWGACEPLRTPRPLGPFLDVAEVTGGELERLTAAAARPHEVAGALLRELRTGGATVLVLEDVHWADEASLDVITLLMARIASAPALVLVSFRDDEREGPSQLRVMLGELAGRATRLKVALLSADAVRALAAEHGVDGGELYLKTSGNPFFVTEVLAAPGQTIPDTVRDAVLARAARLPHAPRRLLEVIAAVPGRVELPMLEALAAPLVAHLEECLDSGMLNAAGAQVAFRHELARLAIEEAISPERRVALHRSVLAQLVARSGEQPEYARLAYHAEAAGDGASVLRYAPRAAERAAASAAHREAASQYARALRFADALPLETRGELLQRTAEEWWLTAQLDAAITAQEEALACWRAITDPRREGNALRLLSRLFFFVGRTTEGEAAVLEAVELLERLEPGHELALAYAAVSQRRMVLEDASGTATWGARALELGERIGDVEVIVYALTNIAAARSMEEGDSGHEMLERALELAQRHGLEDHVGRIYDSFALRYVRRRQFALAEKYLSTGLDYCTQRGLDTWRLYLLALRARVELSLGHGDAAAAAAGLVLRDPHSASLARNWALTTLGLLRARRGDAGAAAALEEAWALAEPTDELDRVATVAAALAEQSWLTGNPAAVGPITDAALDLARVCAAPWFVAELAYWRWRVGIADALPEREMAEPYAASIVGDWRRATRLWSELASPYEAALAQAAGDDPEAIRDAIEQLQRLGARPAAAIIARELRERGVRGVPRGPRPSTRANPAGLTARELEVLALLAEGLRNAQIAERLVVSDKTVDHHVSAILRKLDVRTRGEASAEAARLGLLNAP
jgi:predicted ATPase/DNA-binding CsgD family transcriptional regulator